MEDQHIIRLYHLRDENAILETQNKYGRYCGKIAHNILANVQDTEECVNDTWLAAWNTIPPQKPESLRVYLGCMVRNTAINLYQRFHAKKRFHELDLMLSELDECIPDHDSVEENVEAGVLGAAISGWLMRQSKADRQLFLRRYWYGESVQLLAGELGCSANAVSSRLKRLRNKLKVQLEQEGLFV